jgi:hypothetical protein
MEREEPVEIEASIFVAKLRRRDRNFLAELVVVLIPEWGDHGKPIARSALKDADKYLPPAGFLLPFCRHGRPPKETWLKTSRPADSSQHDDTVAKEDAAREGHINS